MMPSPKVTDYDSYAEGSPSVDTTGHQKKKLRSWLVERLDTNDCPGCRWLDTDDTNFKLVQMVLQHQKLFRLSWKHYGRPGFDEERDATIFRKWAEHTGRYSHGDPQDVSTWKTRFRNALHKMLEIEELSDYHQLDGNDPYRVYRFRNQEEIDSIREKQVNNSVSDISRYPYTPSPPVYVQPTEPRPLPSNHIENARDDEQRKINELAARLQDDSERNSLPLNQQGNTLPPPQMAIPPTLSQQQMPNVNRNGYMPPPFDDSELDWIEKILIESMNVNETSQHNAAAIPSEPLMPPFPSPLINQQLIMSLINANSNIPITAVGVKLHFYDIEVGCKVVNCINGLRISYEPPPAVDPAIAQQPDTQSILSNIYGPLLADQIYYPDSDDHNTQNILKMIQRGVVITVQPNGDIYAKRLSQARVYYSDSPMKTPQPLARSKETLIYSFQNEFLPKLQDYQSQLASPPSCERYFSLGQTWSEVEPLQEMLIRFSITHFLSKKIFKDIRARKNIFVEKSLTNSLDAMQKQLQQMALKY